jgi:hypothetical protein
MTRAIEPLVSILVPAYNAEATLAQTLRSALASSYSNLEIIIVDDGSTDTTPAIAETFARGDGRVRVFGQQHGGVSAALNFGLGRVRGDFVARLDADDLWHPSKLGKQVGLLSADSSLALVYTFIRYVDETGLIVRDAPPQKLSRSAHCQCLYEGIVGGGSSVVLRRSVLDGLGGYDEHLGVWEDLLLHLQVAAVGAFAIIPEFLAGYRLRRGSSSARLEQSLANWRLARKKIETQFPQIPAFVHRWSHARRLLELAEGFAIAARYATSAKLLAECLASDPVRTSAFLAYRLHRRLGGIRRPLHRRGPLFGEADATTNYALSEYDAGLQGSRLGTIDRSRERLLQSIDCELRERQRAPSAQSR